MGRSQGRESVLRRLIERFQNGEVVSDKEIRRELEMVGLRERTSLTADVTEELAELREVSWLEVFLGRKKGQELEDKSLARREEKGEITEDQAVEEWTKSTCMGLQLSCHEADMQSLLRLQRPRKRLLSMSCLPSAQAWPSAQIRQTSTCSERRAPALGLKLLYYLRGGNNIYAYNITYRLGKHYAGIAEDGFGELSESLGPLRKRFRGGSSLRRGTPVRWTMGFNRGHSRHHSPSAPPRGHHQRWSFCTSSTREGERSAWNSHRPIRR